MMSMFKEISKIKKGCPVCEVEKDLIYGTMDEVLKVRGEDIEITSRVHYFPEGNHYFYDVEDEEEKFQIAYREYRKRKGLLQPEKIRQIREQYGLSQKNFARLLDWGDITIHRYESGAIQDTVHNDFLSLIKDFDNFKKY
jgi:putative zinc finger/helix-turn-helix YgiT family protein